MLRTVRAARGSLNAANWATGVTPYSLKMEAMRAGSTGASVRLPAAAGTAEA